MPFMKVMTVGVKGIGCSDWELAVSIINRLFEDNEYFIVFRKADGKTVVTDGNENRLVTVDKPLFSETVWALYGDDGKVQYYTFMLPEEY
ncbi:hypothetical protein ACFFK0_08340 [Paenibacillus chartarius]|uniref:Uncharacterized protein n=1 Tax=Paenibacillus chartarius TaxID=747481 RepID=A0ABV6DIL0_9BACL